MSVLADIYISRDEDAAEYDAKRERPAVDPAGYKNITPLELSTLWAIIRGVQWDIGLVTEFRCVLVVDGGERLIHKLPPAMLADLVTLASDRTGDVSSQWGATEELGWPPEKAREVLNNLVRLARRAIDTGRAVFLWNCV
jgi:hypothetical protein